MMEGDCRGDIGCPDMFRRYSRLIIFILMLGLGMGFMAGDAFADEGNISTTNKYAWGENSGWQNWRPEHGGAAVTATELSGYIWCENVGWVSLKGTADTLVDAALNSYSDDDFNGWRIEITAGTESDQVRAVKDFTGLSGTVTVCKDWATNPASGSTYELSRPTLDNVFENLTRLPATEKIFT